MSNTGSSSPQSPSSTGDAGRVEPLTTFYLAGAVAGDAAALDRLATRLRPVLELMARHRLPKSVKRVYSEEDLIQDVWLVLLDRLHRLRPVGGRLTPVLIRYLRRTTALRVRAILRREILRQRRRVEFDVVSERAQIADPSRDVISRIAVRTASDELVEHIEALPEPMRQIVILRGVEQRPNHEVADLLELTPTNVSKIYGRALEQLRGRWPTSVFSELSA